MLNRGNSPSLSTAAEPNAAMEIPLVSVLLVNWNTREMTLECIRSIYAETKEARFEVIVVDNGSQDESAEAIAAEFPDIVLMAERENHGFAFATNISAARALGRYLLLLNTDTVVLDGAIDKLVAFAERVPGARIWGGRTVFADGSLNPGSVWGKITPWSMFCMTSGLTTLFRSSRLFNPEGYGGWRRDSEREVDVVQGSFFLIEKAFWNELGGFDPAFFMYGEEADLCARARSVGARPRMTPEATIIHYGGRSTRDAAQKIIYKLGCRVGLINRHFKPGWRAYGRALVLLWAWWRARLYSLSARVNKRHAESSAQWREAWNRRVEWRNGPGIRRVGR